MLDFLKRRKKSPSEASPAERAVREERRAIASLADAPLPEITEDMRQELRAVIGEEILSRRPDLDPANLRTYYNNTRPAYALGGLTFGDYDGEKTWENAWRAMLDQIRSMKGTWNY